MARTKSLAYFVWNTSNKEKKFYSVGGYLGYDEGDEQDEDHLGVHGLVAPVQLVHLHVLEPENLVVEKITIWHLNI